MHVPLAAHAGIVQVEAGVVAYAVAVVEIIQIIVVGLERIS
jgi:hypothetical protein